MIQNAVKKKVKLSPNKSKVLSYVLEYHDRHSRVPTAVEIARFMGWKNPSSACHAMVTLSGDGYIKRSWEKGRWLFWVE